MTLMKGGWGRVVWLPTLDAENDWRKRKGTGPFVPLSRDGHLLPNVLELINFIAQHHELVLETGHLSAEEGLMVVHEAHQRGVTHIVVAVLQAEQQRARGPFVFERECGGPIDPDALYDALRNAQDAAGVTHWGLHGLRHLYISKLIESGAPFKTVLSNWRGIHRRR